MSSAPAQRRSAQRGADASLATAKAPPSTPAVASAPAAEPLKPRRPLSELAVAGLTGTTTAGRAVRFGVFAVLSAIGTFLAIRATLSVAVPLAGAFNATDASPSSPPPPTAPFALLGGAVVVATVVVAAAAAALASAVASGQKVRCFMGTGADLRRAYSRMPSAMRAPTPPCWCPGPYLQFAPWLLYNSLVASLAPLRFERQEVEVCGLADKTRPESSENPRSMRDVVVVNYFPPLPASADSPTSTAPAPAPSAPSGSVPSGTPSAAASAPSGTPGATASAPPGAAEEAMPRRFPLDAPAIIVDPGLTCSAQDIPGSSLLRRAYLQGFRVVVLERRGHHGPLRAPRFNIFGDLDDFEQVYSAVQRTLTGAPLFWVGISSGSKLVVEGLGKFDKRRGAGDSTAPRFVAAASICPGYNLETCFTPFRWPFSKICLANAKEVFVARNEAVLRKHDAETFDRVMAAPDLTSMLFAAAPFAGYKTPEEYFAAENPVLYATQARTPTIILNAEDDPMTVVDNAFKKTPVQDDPRTFVEQVEESTCGMLLISSTGSHCPFLDGVLWPFVRVPLWLGGLLIDCWAERCALEFFAGILQENGTKK